MLRKLILFDIDGTLLHTHGAGRRAIHAALLAEFGAAAPDVVRFDGKTDPQIVRELLAASSHPGPPPEHRVAAVCRRYVTLLADELAAPDTTTRLYPGVPALLDQLEARDDTLLGLVTGNLAEGARLKLQAAGLTPDRFKVGAFGSDHHDRAALPPLAARRAAPLMRRVPRGAEVVIIGDTPSDMTCGRSIEARAIGVTTGSYDAAALRAAGAYAVFDTLADAPPVLAAIYA